MALARALVWALTWVRDHGVRVVRPDTVLDGPPSDTEVTNPCRADAVQYWLGDDTVRLAHVACNRPAGAAPGGRIPLLLDDAQLCATNLVQWEDDCGRPTTSVLATRAYIAACAQHQREYESAVALVRCAQANCPERAEFVLKRMPTYQLCGPHAHQSEQGVVRIDAQPPTTPSQGSSTEAPSSTAPSVSLV